MRTGAIFARGSCRALKWMAVFGAVVTLGSGQAVAQTVESAYYNVDGTGVSVVTVKMSADVAASTGGDIFGSFTLGTTTGTAGGPTTTASDEFTVTFGTAAITGMPTLTYTPSITDSDPIINDANGRNVGSFSATVTSAVPDLGIIPSQSAEIGLDFSFEVPEAIGGVGDITYTMVDFGTGTANTHSPGELPDGLEFDGDDRMITGKPTTAGRFRVTVTAEDDAAAELTTASSNHTATADFFIDVSAPPDLTVTVTADPMTIAEGGMSTITATASRMVAAADEPVTITLAVVNADNASATLDESSITIAAGEMSGTATLTATEDDDHMGGTVTVTATGTGITGSQNVRIAVTDEAPPPTLTVTVTADPMTIAEGGMSTITATASRAVLASDGSDGMVTVNLTVVNADNASATLDESSITIAAGAMSGTAMLTATEDDDHVGGTVTVVATGDEVTGGSQQVMIAVTDEAPPPALTVTVTANPTTIAEGGMSTITATASRAVSASDGEVTVNLAVVNADNASATLDESSIIIASGAMSGTAMLTATEDDDHVGGTVTVVATGDEVTGGSQQVMIAVTDEAPPPALTVTVTANPTTIAEGGMSTITATANRAVLANDGEVTVNLTVVNSDNASATLDESSITIAAGAMSGTATLTATEDNDHVGGAVTVVATGDEITGGSQQVMIAVTDEAPPPALTVTVSAAPTTIMEGGTSTITAMANRAVMASDGMVTINLSVVGDATLGANSITIAAGAQSGAVMLTSTQDDDYVDDTVTVTASGTGIQGNAEIMVTVTDDDQPPAKRRGQITAMKITQGSTGLSSREVLPKIMVGGTDRYHVKEGWDNVWLAVTVRWTHKEIAEIGRERQWVHVEIRHRRPGLPIPGVNWVSWIDDEGDADFPQTQTAGRLSGRLQAWVPFTPPSVRPDDYPGSERHHKDRTSYIRVLLPRDQHEAENDAFFIEATAGDVDLDATAAENLTTPVVIIEDVTEQKVSVRRKAGEPSVIYEGAPSPESSTVAGQALYTVSAVPPRVDLPLEVRMDLRESDDLTVRAGNVSLSHSVVTLNPESNSRQDMYLALPNPDGDRVDNTYELQASVVVYSLTSGGEGNTTTPTPPVPVTVYDRHKIPVISMVNPKMASVAEGETVDVTVTVNRNPADTIAYNAELRQYTSEELKVTLSPERSEDYRIMTNPVTIKEHNGRPPWTQTATFTIEAITDDDVDMDTVTLDLSLEVAGTVAVNGSETREEEAAVTVNITDETEKLVWAKTQDEVDAAVNAATSKAAGADGLNPGEVIEILGAELFGAAPGVVVDYAAASSDTTIATGSGSDRRMITVTPMAEGMAMVTVTATATPPSGATIVDQAKPNVAQIMFSVDVVLQDLTLQCQGTRRHEPHRGRHGGHGHGHHQPSGHREHGGDARARREQLGVR